MKVLASARRRGRSAGGLLMVTNIEKLERAQNVKFDKEVLSYVHWTRWRRNKWSSERVKPFTWLREVNSMMGHERVERVRKSGV